MRKNSRVYNVSEADVSWALVTEYTGLAQYIMYSMGIVDTDMLYDVGVPALMYATTQYKPHLGRFRNYVYEVLVNAYKDELLIRASRMRSETDIDNEDVLETLDDTLLEYETKEMVQFYVKGMSKQDKILIALKFWKDLTYEQIELATGVPPATAYRRVKRILERCRERTKSQHGHSV